MRSIPTSVRRLAFALLAVLSAAPLLASSSDLVSANPHAAILPTGTTPPLSVLATINTVDINAYHVSNDNEVTRALGYFDYGKPKILSDDAGGITPAQTKAWIARACNAGQHYEHFDQAIGNKAMSGVIIDAKSDFPAASIEVLEYIRDQSCASDLTGSGPLRRVGKDLYWGNTKVQLVGHSWMGALSGLNFRIPQYLDVLAQHDVNLTRVWVIEQWTAMLVEKAGAPHPSNAVMPFAGAIDFNGNGDTLNLGQVNQAFLNRLRTFVDAAASRGIVVQLTLFDRHGLLNFPDLGRWPTSPYNVANNMMAGVGPGPAGKAPVNFVKTCLPQSFGSPGTEIAAPTTLAPLPAPTSTIDLTCYLDPLNRNLIERIVQELSHAPNVIYEIMNEPLAEEWGTTPIRDWHGWVSGIVKSTN